MKTTMTAMTNSETLRESLNTVEVNKNFTEAVLVLNDNSKLCFCHRVDKRWAKAVGENGLAGELLSKITMFRLNAKHLDIEFEDGSRWEETWRDIRHNQRLTSEPPHQ